MNRSLFFTVLIDVMVLVSEDKLVMDKIFRYLHFFKDKCS